MEKLLSLMNKISRQALLEEVSTTPKPGLVDLHDSGAHRDMDFRTFQVSTHAIVPYLHKMAQAGGDWEGDLPSLFLWIRPMGVKAEQAMFEATGGINTHKGLIFSLGILESCITWYYKRNGRLDLPRILTLCGEMTRDAVDQDFSSIDRNNPATHGERLFVEYGYRGIRGEAADGFPSLRNYALPILELQSKNKHPENLEILFLLMASVDDTNVIFRGGIQAAGYVKEAASRILKLGGSCTKKGMEAIHALNQDFIDKNISPGGCADLLALTIFLRLLMEEAKKCGI